jgi:LPXTG-motif cell wall-anchored protein
LPAGSSTTTSTTLAGGSTTTTTAPTTPGDGAGAGSTTTTTIGSSGALPRTGTDSRGLVVLGLALLLSGGAILVTVRRGRRAGT